MAQWAVLGHQGGWDEIAYLVVPTALMILGVRWAEVRARRKAAESDDTGSVDSDEEPTV